MEGWAAIVLRFAVYADLMALAGLALGGGLRWRAFESRHLLRWLAAIGLALTVAQFMVTAAAMMGDLHALDREMLSFLLFETPMGISALVRAVALAMLAAMGGGRTATLLAGLALGSLAWSGHAAASEGALGWLHRGSDLVHLVAGAVWFGALLILGRALFSIRDEPAAGRDAAAALRRFSVAGTTVVALLVVTGAINLLAIVGWAGLGALPASDYGRLLGLKLLLFAGMLGIAALNRWRLTPALDRASAGDETGAAIGPLRRSIGLELALAVIVLAVVAILGTLSPVD